MSFLRKSRILTLPDFVYFKESVSNLLVNRASAGWRVIPAVIFDHSALAIHVLGSSPISQRVIRPSLVPPLRHNVKISVDAEKLFAAAPIARIGVEDLT